MHGGAATVRRCEHTLEAGNNYTPQQRPSHYQKVSISELLARLELRTSLIWRAHAKQSATLGRQMKARLS